MSPDECEDEDDYDQMVRMLCDFPRRVEARANGEEIMINCVPGLRRWWEIRKAQDALNRALKIDDGLMIEE